MPAITRRDLIGLFLVAPVLVLPAAVRAFGEDSGDWISLFDGKSLAGWKANEHADTFKVENGQIVAHGERTHLFYVGPARNADFKNFQLTAEVMTRPGANSGIYFHTSYQPSGWPAAGFEVQIANTHEGANGYRERKKTGSLYGVRNVYKQLVDDNEWFRMNILVRGKEVRIWVNEMLVVDYVEPDPPFRADPNFQRFINHGTFALQGHDPGSTTYFKNIRVLPLPDNIAQISNERPEVDEIYREILRLGTENYPLVDYDVHLVGGLTIEQALANSRRTGINCGIVVQCGAGFPVHSDDSAREYFDSMEGKPCFLGLQGEGRDWMTIASPEYVASFDYVLSDAMTFTDDHGQPKQINEGIGPIKDKQTFMETYVTRIVDVMQEPVDIYANATLLPDQIAGEYDALWTPERMHKVIDAAVKNEVAIEINNRYKIPSAAFIRTAKTAGAKFALGTNNSGANLGRLEYPIEMVQQCGLVWQDIFVPKPAGQKPIEVKKWRPA
jgi:hypothetical protein